MQGVEPKLGEAPVPANPGQEAWHGLTAERCLERLEVDGGQGLGGPQLQLRLRRYAPNRIDASGRRGIVGLLIDQFRDPMILVLIVAALISGLIGETLDTIAVLVIIALNAGIGFAQSWNADRAIDALRQFSTPLAKVRRDGLPLTIPAEQLVPGDIVAIDAGDLLPADLRLIETQRFYCDESILTGESLPAEKHSKAIPADAPLAERGNMAYKGTLAIGGRATGVVVATGMDSELGKVAGLLLRQHEVKTALQLKLARLGRQLTLVVVLIAALVFALGFLRGNAVLPMLLIALSLAVAAIPEALPAVLTMSMSLGAARMAAQRALVRRLPAVETLGSVTRICSDKTGTLTLNRMQVLETWSLADGGRLQAPDIGAALSLAMALNNDVGLGVGESAPTGDPTEIALALAAQAAGAMLPALRARWPRVAELPFDSDRKRMLTVHRGADGRWLALLKGAPEAVLPRCIDGGSAALAAEMERMAGQGGRVLAFAQRELSELPADLETLEQDLQFIGLASLLDPPRAEAAAAVQAAAAAGIETLMITGDHPATAAAIARHVGIATQAGVLTGAQIQLMSDEQLRLGLADVRVFARVSPEQKIRIVQALRDSGEVVAVTGDGVNDAPALKAADIGVAMGRGGTDVAREAADLVLLDDNFATIITAVREGRRIYDNIRKFVKYALTTNSAELLTLAISPLLGMPLAFLPIQILWINLISDGLPGLALARDPADPDVMRRAPRRPADGLFAAGLGAHIIWMGLFMATLILALQAWAQHRGIEHAQTLVFTSLIFAEMAQVLAVRAGWQPATGRELLRNPYLLAAVGATLLSQIVIIYWPPANRIFSTQPLSALELGLCGLLALMVFGACEAEKFAVRRGILYRRR